MLFPRSPSRVKPPVTHVRELQLKENRQLFRDGLESF